ncbi:hypothetical protein SAMN05444375_10256 [Segatella baroniae B14]|nr:hypothetical protein SAMN05444375_10256 [Segatella baroniae B14]
MVIDNILSILVITYLSHFCNNLINIMFFHFDIPINEYYT